MPLAYWGSFEKRSIATLRFNTIPSSWTWFVGVSTMTVFRCADANCIDINRAINKQNFFIVVVQINQRLPNRSVILLSLLYTYIKAWSQSCYSFHLLRPSHCPDCRNEQRQKPHVSVTYIIHPPDNERYNRPKPMRAVYNTPHEAFPLLCFDNP